MVAKQADDLAQRAVAVHLPARTNPNETLAARVHTNSHGTRLT